MATVDIIFQATDKASPEIKTLNTHLDNTEKSGGRAARGVNTFGDTLKAILTAGIIKKVFQGIVDFGKQIVSAAMEEEVAFAGLQVAIENTGAVYEDAEGKINDYIKAQMATTTYGEEEQVKSIQTLTEMTGDYNEALELETLAQDLAAAKGMDLVTASELVGKVATGNLGMLSRYGIVVGKDATATEALAIMTQKFGGQAAKLGATGSGSIKRMTNQFGELKDTLGKALLPTLGKIAGAFADFLSDNMPAIAAFAEKVGTWIAGAFEKVWDWVGKAYGKVDNFFKLLGPALDTMSDAARGTGAFQSLIDLFSFLGMDSANASKWGEALYNIAGGIGEIISGNPADMWLQLGVPQGVIDSIYEVQNIFGGVVGIIKTAIAGIEGENVWEDTMPQLDMKGNFTAATPGLKTQLVALGTKLWGFLKAAFLKAATIMADLSEKIADWAKDPATQSALHDFGSKLATGTLTAMTTVMGSDVETEKAATGIGGALTTIVSNMTSVLFNVGYSLGSGIVDGIVAKLRDGALQAAFASVLLSIFGLEDPNIMINKQRNAGKPPSLYIGPSGMLPFPPSTQSTNNSNSTDVGGVNININSSNPRMSGDSVLRALRAAGVY